MVFMLVTLGVFACNCWQCLKFRKISYNFVRETWQCQWLYWQYGMMIYAIGRHSFINMLLTLSWRGPLSYRNQSIDLQRNQWTGFYMITASLMKKLTVKRILPSFYLTHFSCCISGDIHKYLNLSLFAVHMKVKKV